MAEAAIDWRHFLGASEWRFDTAVCLLSGQEPRKLGSTQDPSEIDRDWAQWIQAAIGDNKLFPQYNFSHGTLVFLVPNLLRWCHYEAMPAPEPVQEQAVVSAGYWQEQFTLDLKTGGYWLPQECAAFLLGLTPSECEDFRMRYRERVVHQHNWFVRIVRSCGRSLKAEDRNDHWAILPSDLVQWVSQLGVWLPPPVLEVAQVDTGPRTDAVLDQVRRLSPEQRNELQVQMLDDLWRDDNGYSHEEVIRRIDAMNAALKRSASGAPPTPLLPKGGSAGKIRAALRKVDTRPQTSKPGPNPKKC